MIELYFCLKHVIKAFQYTMLISLLETKKRRIKPVHPNEAEHGRSQLSRHDRTSARDYFSSALTRQIYQKPFAWHVSIIVPRKLWLSQ